ncbi:MAG TPA: glycosyltransferase [Flavobacteriales bacterium]|nr:glycosyltransferase [Flavobacteriales bacterium]
MQPTLAIIAPCFNESGAVQPFLSELEQVLARVAEDCLLVLVDDGSLDDTRDQALGFRTTAPNVLLKVISLPYNMGHQEAIYQGLLYASTTTAQRFVVMDGDGEDDPGALVELAGIRDASVVFVGRGKRSESVGFQLGYRLYRLVFRIVAGRSINFGNYSMIDRRVLGAVLDRSFVHYAAFLSKQQVPSRIVVRDRRRRLDGISKMGFHDLSVHALRSLIEYGEEVLGVFLKAFLYLSLLFMLSVLAIVGIKVFTDLAIPGWASNLSATMFNSMLLCLGFFVIGLLLANTAHRRERAGRHLYKVAGGSAAGQ